MKPGISQLDLSHSSNGTSHSESIAIIRLQGEPYVHEVEGERIDASETLNDLVVNSGYLARLDATLINAEPHLHFLDEGGYYALDAKIKAGEQLSYSDAYSAAVFVIMGVSKAVFERLAPRIPIPDMTQETVFYQAIALLSALSAKEAYVGLAAPEIAGLVAGVLEIDTIVRLPFAEGTIGMGGMGGDHGYTEGDQQVKPFSVSTLSALLLANVAPVHKHHSYPNTSKVAGQSAIEAYGARSDQNTEEAFFEVQNEANLIMSSCHSTRLIHTLSHKLKGETINHIIGPLAIPVAADTEVSGFFGVNQSVHPQTLIEALQILEAEGVQAYSGAVAMCGLALSGLEDSRILDPDTFYANSGMKKLVAIDEVAPPPYLTLASFLVDDQQPETYVISPEDFYDAESLSDMTMQNLMVDNEETPILEANLAALDGGDMPKAKYLAMSAGLALFAREYAGLPGALIPETHSVNRDMLREATLRCLDLIKSGKGVAKLEQYVSATKLSMNLNHHNLPQ